MFIENIFSKVAFIKEDWWGGGWGRIYCGGPANQYK
jgi:hypothetical protein